MAERRAFDVECYANLVRERRCFVCGLVSGDRAFAHHIVYEDDFAIAFLNKFPPLLGYVLVCSKEHREQVTGDFTPSEYMRLQAVVYAVCEAVRLILRPERVYILSLGSQDANAHVHWHVAPLPAGVPLEQQQFAALDAERAGVLLFDDAEGEMLARQIGGAVRIPPM